MDWTGCVVGGPCVTLPNQSLSYFGSHIPYASKRNLMPGRTTDAAQTSRWPCKNQNERAPTDRYPLLAPALPSGTKGPCSHGSENSGQPCGSFSSRKATWRSITKCVFILLELQNESPGAVSFLAQPASLVSWGLWRMSRWLQGRPPLLTASCPTRTSQWNGTSEEETGAQWQGQADGWWPCLHFFLLSTFIFTCMLLVLPCCPLSPLPFFPTQAWFLLMFVSRFFSFLWGFSTVKYFYWNGN